PTACSILLRHSTDTTARNERPRRSECGTRSRDRNHLLENAGPGRRTKCRSRSACFGPCSNVALSPPVQSYHRVGLPSSRESAFGVPSQRLSGNLTALFGPQVPPPVRLC